VIVVDDIVKGSASIIEQHMESLKRNTGRRSQRMLVIRPILKSAYNEAEVDNIIAQFGGVDKVKLSSLNYATVKRQTSYVKRAKGHCLKFTGFKEKSYGGGGTSFSYSRLTWQAEEVDFEAGGFYMPMHRFTPMHKNSAVNNLESILAHAVSLGLIEDGDDDRTYGMTEKDIALVKDDPEWVNLFDHIEERYLAGIASGRFVNGTALTQFNECRERGLMTFFGERPWKDNKDALLDGAFKDFGEAYRDLIDRSEAVDQNALAELGSRLGLSGKLRPAVQAVVSKLNDLWKDVMLEYPMLSMIGWSERFGAHNTTVLLDYIHTIDQMAAQVSVQPLKVAA
jgi:hypothetical protein